MNLAALALAATLTVAAAPADDAREPLLRVVTLDGRHLEADAFRTDGGGLVLTVDKKDQRVDFSDLLEATTREQRRRRREPAPASVEVELSNGDLVRGLLVSAKSETGFTVASPALGRLEVSLDFVLRVRFLRNLERFEDPVVLTPGDKTDRFLFASGDQLEGTLRAVGTDGVTVRTSAGRDRTLPIDDLVGFALVPFPGPEEKGVRVRVDLNDGSRLSGASLQGIEDGKRLLLKGTMDGHDHSFATTALASITARGGKGVILSDLRPISVEVKPYWGDDPMVLHHVPRYDRAFTLAPGAPPALRLGGRRYARGISVFSGTTLTYDLDGKNFKQFTASVGVDDAGVRGAVEFEVLLDGESVWKSGVVRVLKPGETPLKVPAVDVSGRKTLQLRVHAGPGDDVQDYADWVGAALR
ncbi:MAG: NPCBM/NEW2 domain-containing protein [Planctomycetota bacterium]|jgi:hypothetical protein